MSGMLQLNHKLTGFWLTSPWTISKEFPVTAEMTDPAKGNRSKSVPYSTCIVQSKEKPFSVYKDR